MQKGNIIENWDVSYKNLNVTYTESINNPTDLSMVSLYQYVYEDIVKYLPNYESARILECGCGGARVSLYLALRRFSVTCSDNSDEALRLAEENFRAFGAKGIFLLDDLMNSEIPTESFDCVMSFGLLEHFKDLNGLIANLTRMVRPGGIQIHFIIPSKLSTDTMANLFWFHFRFLNFALRHRQFRNIIRKSYREFPHFENRFSWQEYSNAFIAEGNQMIRCEPQK